VKSQFYVSFFAATLISCERVDVSWLLVLTACGLKRERKRRKEREKGERERGEREREREKEKMSVCSDVKM
jgi:hypothetical protein